MRKLILATVGAAAMAVASAAGAQATGGTITTFNNDLGIGGSFTTGFSDANMTNPFSETLTFTTTTSGFFDIFFSTTGGSNPATDTDFTSAFLTGTGIGSISIDPLTGEPNESRARNNIFVGPGTFTLTINGTPGTASGSLGGTAAFTAGAIPEPGTWMMMLFGFGAVGFSIRRQRRSNMLPQIA